MAKDKPKKDDTRPEPDASASVVASVVAPVEVPSGFVEPPATLPVAPTLTEKPPEPTEGLWDCECPPFPKRRVFAKDAGEARLRYGEALGIWSFPREPDCVPVSG